MALGLLDDLVFAAVAATGTLAHPLVTLDPGLVALAVLLHTAGTDALAPF